MKSKIALVMITAALLFAADTKNSGPTIFMAGDSTMANKPMIPPYPERGWGQMLTLYFKPGAHVDNYAKNGRSSKSFRDEGIWQVILDRLQPGDFVIIQFAHNDEKAEDPKRYADPSGAFKKNLAQFVQDVRERKGRPILATPIARRAFDNTGRARNTHGEYPGAVRQIATELQVPLLEMTTRSEELLSKLGPEASKKLFVWTEPGEYDALPEGRKDDTHLNSLGAARICDLAADEIKKSAPELAGWLLSK
jgi:lysophospholipase L1-like esterase